ncbi:MAG: FMN-binding protein [Candidatus Cloacimonetes bacterium]|jgi:uncharacterized protein with FMN-binding domain|nr:FMN-binding protein [Candidatus Cloacimonadota bacterium]
MKKKTKVFIIILFILLVIGGGATYFVKMTEKSLAELSSTEIVDVDLTTLDDGTYLGSYKAFPVSVEVEVTVLNHEITEIVILKHDSGQGEPAEVIILDVIEMQSLNVDLVSGATYSSKVILLAIHDALMS